MVVISHPIPKGFLFIQGSILRIIFMSPTQITLCLDLSMHLPTIELSVKTFILQKEERIDCWSNLKQIFPHPLNFYSRIFYLKINWDS